MKAALFGIASLALGSLGLAAPASALPIASGIAPAPSVEQARMVSRRVVRGPRCKTVTVKRRGPMGGMKIMRRRTCL